MVMSVSNRWSWFGKCASSAKYHIPFVRSEESQDGSVVAKSSWKWAMLYEDDDDECFGAIAGVLRSGYFSVERR